MLPVRPKPGGTCPEAGGCESCPEPEFCAGLRVGAQVTTIDEEFPTKEENGSKE